MGSFLAWWGRYGTPATTATSFIGFIAVVASWFGPTTVKEVIYAIGLVFVFAGGAATFAILSVRLGRRARYAEAFANVREVIRKIAVEDLAEFRKPEQKKLVLASAMDDLSRAFSLLTGSNCRCCIKTIAPDNSKTPQEMLVITLCRNSEYQAQDAPHPIQFNTDFNDLYQDKNRKWFIANDLPEMARAGKYLNTNTDWMTRYRSTVTWPIRRDPGVSEDYPDLMGFLCIDSKRTRPFSEEYDYPLGALVADTLYPFLFRLAQSAKQTPSPATSVPSQTMEAASVAPPQGVPKQ